MTRNQCLSVCSMFLMYAAVATCSSGQIRSFSVDEAVAASIHAEKVRREAPTQAPAAASVKQPSGLPVSRKPVDQKVQRDTEDTPSVITHEHLESLGLDPLGFRIMHVPEFMKDGVVYRGGVQLGAGSKEFEDVLKAI